MAGKVKDLSKYFKEVRQELRKVHWPNRREITVYTSMVLTTVLFIGVFFWLLDAGFTELLKLILQ
ncbi:MAG TPA: preprotein translocase subunit SecE [Firmicutes bacterium]|nr:preprotein translocase subunit SecE [Bacillota bacterium]HAA37543.1 preprotein translocase subunit SecE [Bacillota bacterium]